MFPIIFIVECIGNMTKSWSAHGFLYSRPEAPVNDFWNSAAHENWAYYIADLLYYFGMGYIS